RLTDCLGSTPPLYGWGDTRSDAYLVPPRVVRPLASRLPNFPLAKNLPWQLRASIVCGRRIPNASALVRRAAQSTPGKESEYECESTAPNHVEDRGKRSPSSSIEFGIQKLQNQGARPD